jgi:hypothetical protein
MQPSLEILLQQLRDKPLAPDERQSLVASARELARADERFPEDVRALVFLDPSEASADAAGLLAILGLDDLGDLLTEALGAQIVEVDGSLDVEEQVWAPYSAAIRSSVIDLAGELEVSDVVFRTVGADERRAPVRDAVLSACGPVEVVEQVLAAVGLVDSRPAIAAAIHAEAGAVDIVEPVLTAVAPRKRLFDLPKAANDPRPAAWYRRSGFIGVALAAAAALLLTFTRGPVGSAEFDIHPLVFAQAGDVVIEDLTVGDGVQVIQIEGADGSVILWVDEEA